MATLTKEALTDYINEQLNDTDCFLVDLTLTKTDIIVGIDSDSSVDIDFVSELNRKIEEHFSPDIDSYNLEVGSVGLTAPLVLPRQFKKNIGNDVEVLATDGKKYHGLLKDADELGFTISFQEKVKKEGEKRPTLETVDKNFSYPDVKKVTYELKF